MKRFSFTILILLTACLYLLTAAPAMAETETLKLGILHTNDTHGHLLPYYANGEPDWSGVARRRVEIQRQRADTDYYWLLLDAGDVFQGTPISNMLTGYLDLECMNQMGYDAMCLGNHEFDFGYDLIRSRLLDVNFSVLSCNVIDKERGTPVAEPYRIFRRGDYRIGVIGLTTETLIYETHPRIADYVNVYQPAMIVKSLATYLREIGCDVIVVLGHQGYNRDIALAELAPEVDVIVGGHSHTFLDEPTLVGDVVVTQNGQWAENLGVLKLTFERDDPTERFWLADIENEYVPLSADKPQDDGLRAFIGDYEQRLAAEMDRYVCDAGMDFSVDEVRLAENPLANLICDSMRAVTESDTCLFNGGNFRAGLKAGPVTFGDLYGVLPYDNFMMRIPLSGAELRAVLAYAGQQYGDGGFPQVSGLKVRYVDMELVDVQVEQDGQWMPLDDSAEYTLLTNDFLAVGGDGFPLSEDPYGPGYLGLEQRATFAQWASQQGELMGDTDGRVVFEWVAMENPGLAD